MASAAFDASNQTALAEATSDNTKVSEAVGDIMFDLSDLDSTWWNNQSVSGGGDVRVTDDTGTKFGSETAYSFELENFNNNGDGTGTGIIFFDSSHISTSSNKTWRIYCGDSSLSLPADSDTLGAHNVWNSNHDGRWDLAESSGSTSEDSTSNNNDGTFNGNLPTQVSGKIGNAQSLDGDGDYVNTGASGDYGSGAYSVIFWVNIDNTNRHRFVGNFDGSGWLVQYINDQVRWYDGNTLDTNTSLSTGSWSLIVATRDSSGNRDVYINGGTSDGSDTSTSGVNTTQDFWIGDTGSSSNATTGDMDEVRLLSSHLSSGYVSTLYNNQNSPSTFWTVGATETNGGGADPLLGQLATLGVGK